MCSEYFPDIDCSITHDFSADKLNGFIRSLQFVAIATVLQMHGSDLFVMNYVHS